MIVDFRIVHFFSDVIQLDIIPIQPELNPIF